jgi:hypothetical protein
MALIVKGLRRIMKNKKFGKMGQSSKIASIVVKLDIFQLIVQTRKKTNMERRKTRRVYLRGRNITRRRKMAKHILLSGIPMQAPMKMMMTSLQEVLLGLLSRKLLHSSPSHIVLWKKVNQR